MSDKNLSIPKVEIIDSAGKPVSQERMDPSILSFVMQAAQTAQLVRLRKLEENKIPTGTFTRVFDLTTTILKYDIANPWISFTIINAGSGAAKLKILKLEGGIDQEAEIDEGQILNFNFNFPIVYRIFLSSVTTCQVRIYAIEGTTDEYLFRERGNKIREISIVDTDQEDNE